MVLFEGKAIAFGPSRSVRTRPHGGPQAAAPQAAATPIAELLRLRLPGSGAASIARLRGRSGRGCANRQGGAGASSCGRANRLSAAAPRCGDANRTSASRSIARCHMRTRWHAPASGGGLRMRGGVRSAGRGADPRIAAASPGIRAGHSLTTRIRRAARPGARQTRPDAGSATARPKRQRKSRMARVLDACLGPFGFRADGLSSRVTLARSLSWRRHRRAMRRRVTIEPVAPRMRRPRVRSSRRTILR